MKVTFTLEAIVGMEPEKLGELIKDRARAGVRSFEVVPIDEAIGRLAASGVRIVDRTRPPLEIEPRTLGPCPVCGADDEHWIMGVDDVPDHRWGWANADRT